MTRFVLFISAILLIAGCGSRQSSDQPAAKTGGSTAAVATPRFDGKRAFQYLTAQTDFGPRVPNTRNHEQCLVYLQNELALTADTVVLQSFRYPGYDGVTLQLTNLLASFNSAASTRILLIAHWDSRPQADEETDSKKSLLPVPGANDGASGVAVLLEIARHLKEQSPRVGVDIILTDGEDYGKEHDLSNYFLGSKYFATHLPYGFHPMYGILLDMVGDSQLQIPKEPNSIHYAADVVDLVWSTARSLGIYQFSPDIQRPVSDDHLPFNEVGIRTIDLIDFDYPDASNRFWHTTQDTPDKCSAASLEAVGTVLLTVIYQQNP
jgi:glutaminyl-peptide cyclotransferase